MKVMKKLGKLWNSYEGTYANSLISILISLLSRPNCLVGKLKKIVARMQGLEMPLNVFETAREMWCAKISDIKTPVF